MKMVQVQEITVWGEEKKEKRGKGNIYIILNLFNNI